MYLEYLNKFMEMLKNTQISFLDKNKVLGEDEFSFIINLFEGIRQKNKCVFFIGNGGSAGIASHMTADFLKNGKLKTYSLYDSAILTCLGNDYGYQEVFAKQIEINGNSGDLLVAISSSGNSLNIIKAVQAAKNKNLQIITFSGFKEDNQLRQLGAYNIYVPIEHYGMVESIHNLLLQQIVDSLMIME